MRYAIGALSILLCAICPHFVSASGISKLTQQIDPIECTYTNVNTSLVQTSLNTLCNNTSVPMLDTIIYSTGGILLSGRANITHPSLIRFWIAGKWFTYGVYPGVTVMGNLVTLTISFESLGLPPGQYTVVLEASNIQDIMYRSVYPGSLIVPVRTVTTTTTNTSGTVISANTIDTGGVRYTSNSLAIAPASDHQDSLHDDDSFVLKTDSDGGRCTAAATDWVTSDRLDDTTVWLAAGLVFGLVIYRRFKTGKD